MPGDGADTTLQAVPFQCRISTWSEVERHALPTAQTSVLDVPETPVRWELRMPGLVTTLQLVPFQCSIRLFPLAKPTAQTSLEAIAVTALNEPPPDGGRLGLETMLHCVPFQCSTSGVVVLLPVPTAHTSLLDTPATPVKKFPGALGLGTTLQEVPLKCSAGRLELAGARVRHSTDGPDVVGGDFGDRVEGRLVHARGRDDVKAGHARQQCAAVEHLQPRPAPRCRVARGRVRPGHVAEYAAKGGKHGELLEIKREQGMNGRGFPLARTRRLTVSSRERAASSESRPFRIDEDSSGRMVTRI